VVGEASERSEDIVLHAVVVAPGSDRVRRAVPGCLWCHAA
jgi:hypothetical protein